MKGWLILFGAGVSAFCALSACSRQDNEVAKLRQELETANAKLRAEVESTRAKASERELVLDQEARNLRRELEGLKARAALEQAKAVGLAKSTKVQGSVFIVTRDATNVKLGLVNIAFIQEDAYLAYWEQLKTAREKSLPKALDEYGTAERNYQLALAALNARLAAYNAANDRLKAEAEAIQHLVKIEGADIFLRDSASDDVAKKYIAAHHQVASIGASLPLLYASAEQAERNVLSAVASLRAIIYISASNLVGSIPGQDIAKTDADGKFSFLVGPPVRGYLYARAKRLVGTENEEYAWITRLEATSSDEEVSLILSNDGLVSTQKVLAKELPEIEKLPPEVSIEDFKEFHTWRGKEF